MNKIDEFDNNFDTDEVELLYINDRPVWGPDIYDLETVVEFRNNAIEKINSLINGGALIIPFAKNAERSVLIFLNILTGKLLDLKYKVHYDQFLCYPYLNKPLPEINIWRIHHAPRYKNLNIMMENWIKPGSIAILTGLDELFDKDLLKIPFNIFSEFSIPNVQFDQEIENALMSVLNEIKENNITKKAHHVVCLCDGWGVPLPFDLLSKILDQDPDTLSPVIERAYQKEILFWIEPDRPPSLLVSNVSEAYALQYLKFLSKEKLISLNDYISIFEVIDCKIQDERYTALKLIQSWLVNTKIRYSISSEKFCITQIKEFILKNWNLLKKIAFSGNSIEHLVWSQCLAQVNMFNYSYEILESGLNNDPKNIFLNQYKAHLLALWCRVNPAKIKNAHTAFAEATNICKNNIWLWQARGDFEAKSGNRMGAETCFKKALEIDPKNIHTLAARADMNLDYGLLDRAELDLKKADIIDSQNMYIKHLKGRLFFYQGKWHDAEQEWEKMLISNKQHPFALQSLGNMARERGLWDQAQVYLNKALTFDPENIAVLLEIGVLKRKWGQFELDMGNVQKAKEFFSSSFKILQKAKMLEPENPKVIVEISSLDRLLGNIETAIERLEKILLVWPNNIHARHLLALCFADQGLYIEMETQFKKILSNNKKNILVYYSLARINIIKNNISRAKEYLRQADRIEQSLNLPIPKKINTLIEKNRILKLMNKNEEL